MSIEVKTVHVGLLKVGCHLVWDSERREGFVVDAGSDAELIIDGVEAGGFTPVAVLLTHGHVDHISALGEVCARYEVPVYLHAADRGLYVSPDNCFTPWLPLAENLPEPVHELPSGLPASVQVLHTPGHTPGSVCFHLPAEKLVFTGDTLFHGGVGRSDFKGGDQQALERSIRERLYALSDDTRVYPGHNEPTTIGEERRSNPFIRG